MKVTPSERSARPPEFTFTVPSREQLAAMPGEQLFTQVGLGELYSSPTEVPVPWSANLLSITSGYVVSAKVSPYGLDVGVSRFIGTVAPEVDQDYVSDWNGTLPGSPSKPKSSSYISAPLRIPDVYDRARLFCSAADTDFRLYPGMLERAYAGQDIKIEAARINSSDIDVAVHGPIVSAGRRESRNGDTAFVSRVLVDSAQVAELVDQIAQASGLSAKDHELLGRVLGERLVALRKQAIRRVVGGLAVKTATEQHPSQASKLGTNLLRLFGIKGF